LKDLKGVEVMNEKHEKLKYLYVGIDIYKEIHVAVIIDCWNDKLGEITFANKPSAFPKFVEKVKEYCEEGIRRNKASLWTGGCGWERESLSSIPNRNKRNNKRSKSSIFFI
jgi:hypothetical protein